MIGAFAIIDVLTQWPVEYVFGCPGTTEVPVLEQLSSDRPPRFILTTHESVAVAMADGYSRVTGGPSIALIHTTVGLSNALAHLFGARLGYSPVVILNGLKPRLIHGRRGFTTSPNPLEIVAPYVKWAWEVKSRGSLREDLVRALKESVSSNGGPVYLGVPQDIMEQEQDEESENWAAIANAFVIHPAVRPAQCVIQGMADMLTSSHRPVILAGNEVGRRKGVDCLVKLSETVNAAVLSEDRLASEINAFPTKHPNYVGIMSIPLLQRLAPDVMLVAGGRMFLEFEPRGNLPLGSQCRVIHVHFDSRELADRYPYVFNVVADIRELCNDLCALIPPASPVALDKWWAVRKGNSTSHTLPSLARQVEPLSVRSVLEVVGNFIQPNDIVVGDAVTSAEAVLSEIPRFDELSYLTNASSGSLGWGIPASLGVTLALPNRHVWAIVGDGTVHFALPALFTAKKYALNVTVIVLNNQSYAAVRAAYQRRGRTLVEAEGLVGTSLEGVYYAQIAQGFGWKAQRVETWYELENALKTARERSGPFLIEIMTDPHDVGPLSR
jgi:thiamine pyrophosphate-dependent acetolactate synthase large subunit-like protein